MLAPSLHRRPHRSRLRLVAVLTLTSLAVLGSAAVVSAQATRTATPTPTVTATPMLVRVVVGPATAKRQVGQTQNFTATGFYSDGATKNLTQKVIYSSSDLNVAFPPNTAGNMGLVEAVGVGTATISITEPTTGVNSNATGDNATLEVVEAPTPTPTHTGATPTATRTPVPTVTATPKLVSVTIGPSTAKRQVGQTQNFTASGLYSDGSTKNLTQLVTYGSSNNAVAQAPNTPGNRGLVSAVGPGTATISAVEPGSGVSSASSGGDAVITVTVPPTPTPTHTGATPTRTLSPTPTVTATPILVAIAVLPATAKRPVGAFQNFTCTGTYSDGSTKNLTQRVDYASNDPTVADAPNLAGNKGRVNAVGVGTATISASDAATGVTSHASGGDAAFQVVVAPTPTATHTGVTATPTRTPTPTPTATPSLVSMTLGPATVKRPVGQSQVFVTTGTYSDGSTKNLTQKVVYASSNSAVASAPNDLASKSKVLAVAPGTATISATDPATGITTTSSGGDATFTVTVPPSPSPTHTGPTSTAPTGSPTLTPPPSPTATPRLLSITLGPQHASKPVGSSQNFTAMGTFDDGSTKNFTQRVTYASSDPSVAQAPNSSSNRGQVLAVAVGTATISATETVTGIVSTASNGDATFTVVAAGTPKPTAAGSPNPNATPTSGVPLATPTPGVPLQTGDPVTGCQTSVERAGRTFVVKKLRTLERCGSAASRCIERKPADATCLLGVRGHCLGTLAKLADDQASMVAGMLRHCAVLNPTDVLGDAGLGYGDLSASCAQRFGRAVTDLPSAAQCLGAEHACGAEEIFAAERPRAGELLRLLGAAPDAEACRVDFGGTGAGVGDPKGVGRAVDRCLQAVVRSGTALAKARLAAIGRCIDQVFLCVHVTPSDPTCIPQATQRCDKEFAHVQRAVAATTVDTSKRCSGLDFDVLRGATGGNLDAMIPSCSDYGVAAVANIGDYAACLVRQHECLVADLIGFEAPHAADLLGEAGRQLTSGPCP